MHKKRDRRILILPYISAAIRILLNLQSHAFLLPASPRVFDFQRRVGQFLVKAGQEYYLRQNARSTAGTGWGSEETPVTDALYCNDITADGNGNCWLTFHTASASQLWVVKRASGAVYSGETKIEDTGSGTTLQDAMLYDRLVGGFIGFFWYDSTPSSNTYFDTYNTAPPVVTAVARGDGLAWIVAAYSPKLKLSKNRKRGNNGLILRLLFWLRERDVYGFFSVFSV